ncbi:MAG TPA: DUF305 domain-containing protein [Gammaproteobacteria bacterium]
MHRPAFVSILLLGLGVVLGGQASRAATDDEALYTETDLLFLQHMIVHHEQAVAMSALVPERTDRQAFVRYADYVARAQEAEIAVMQSLLDLAAERGLEIPASHTLHADPPMQGMLSSAQMAALAAADGREFERLWLEGMILHHEGAIDMARAQQLAQLRDGRRPYGIDVLVEGIIEDQRAEIAQMRRWLDEWTGD